MLTQHIQLVNWKERKRSLWFVPESKMLDLPQKLSSTYLLTLQTRLFYARGLLILKIITRFSVKIGNINIKKLQNVLNINN